MSLPLAMHYTISYSNSLTHFLDIEVLVKDIKSPYVDLKLPAWRPGRYEAAYYAKNVQQLRAYSIENTPLKVIKISPTSWRVTMAGENDLKVKYRYYAHQMDAGGSFLDERFLYINFVNCMVYTESRIDSPHEVRLNIPGKYKVACSLQGKGNTRIANSYHELVDSPLVASEGLQCHRYSVGDVTFYLWIEGEHALNMDTLILQFKKFSETQVALFGEFPTEEYHFLFLFLPYRFYHGVEHHKSTVICIGPSAELDDAVLYRELLGVSSHELFHAWNMMKIRPKELTPLNLDVPIVFPTGFVAEGFTTYYTDLMLVRSGVFSPKEYFKELERLFTRHFLNFGRLNNSLVDSSIDLWMDGYQPSAPHKKSSIYVEGAVLALLLDLTTRKATGDSKSLDDVMRMLWKEHGKTGKGYSLGEILVLCERASGLSMNAFFEDFAWGTRDTRELLQECLKDYGLKLSFEDRSNRLERTLGIRMLEREDGWEVVSIEPGCVGEQFFSMKDMITAVDQAPVKEWLELETVTNDVRIELTRHYTKKHVQLPIDDNNSYLKVPKITLEESLSEEQKAKLASWLNTSSYLT